MGRIQYCWYCWASAVEFWLAAADEAQQNDPHLVIVETHPGVRSQLCQMTSLKLTKKLHQLEHQTWMIERLLRRLQSKYARGSENMHRSLSRLALSPATGLPLW